MPRIDREDRGLTLRAMSTVALVGVLATGCDSQPRDSRAQWRGPYQIETALVVSSPAKSASKTAQPAIVAALLPTPRPASPLAATKSPIAAPLALKSVALTVETAAIPIGPLVAPAIEPEASAPAELAAAIPALAGSPSGAATIDQVPTDLAYIPQINDSARAAYIAQVDAAEPGQRMAVRAGDQVLGQVEFQVADGQVSVRIGQVLDLFQGRMDGAEFAQLRASSAAREFVSLDRLHAAGIPLDYNAAYDELTLDTGRS
jgi:hypothetical protein